MTRYALKEIGYSVQKMINANIGNDFFCPHRVICVWYKVQVYRQWLFIYIYYNWYVASIDFICTSCTGWIKSAGSTFEFSAFGILDVRKLYLGNKRLRLIAFCSFLLASCLYTTHLFPQCVSFRSERIYARKKSCATLQLDAVGFFAKFVILKSDVYLSRVPTAQVRYVLSCS